MSVPLRRLQQAPRHLLVCEKGHVRHARSRHAAHVRDHAYNCRVSVLIPECGMLPEVLKSTIADVGEYYLVRSLSVHQLVAHEFVDCFVRKAILTAHPGPVLSRAIWAMATVTAGLSCPVRCPLSTASSWQVCSPGI
uniref:Uncharacterized protein n=1 Tax=Pavo cristatus TaxID=9049 RepID=A0A8C9F9H6_PAVCR